MKTTLEIKNEVLKLKLIKLFRSFNVQGMLKNDDDNVQLQVLQESFISLKYKKIFCRKIRLLAVPSGFYSFYTLCFYIRSDSEL